MNLSQRPVLHMRIQQQLVKSHLFQAIHCERLNSQIILGRSIIPRKNRRALIMKNTTMTKCLLLCLWRLRHNSTLLGSRNLNTGQNLRTLTIMQFRWYMCPCPC